jgi:hypothetical protein
MSDREAMGNSGDDYGRSVWFDTDWKLGGDRGDAVGAVKPASEVAGKAALVDNIGDIRAHHDGERAIDGLSGYFAGVRQGRAEASESSSAETSETKEKRRKTKDFLARKVMPVVLAAVVLGGATFIGLNANKNTGVAEPAGPRIEQEASHEQLRQVEYTYFDEVKESKNAFGRQSTVLDKGTFGTEAGLAVFKVDGADLLGLDDGSGDPLLLATFMAGRGEIKWADVNETAAEFAERRFIKMPRNAMEINNSEWSEAIQKFMGDLNDPETKYEWGTERSSHSSAYFTDKDDDGVPELAQSHNVGKGGHFLIITFKDGTRLELRFDCGLQPTLPDEVIPGVEEIGDPDPPDPDPPDPDTDTDPDPPDPVPTGDENDDDDGGDDGDDGDKGDVGGDSGGGDDGTVWNYVEPKRPEESVDNNPQLPTQVDNGGEIHVVDNGGGGNPGTGPEWRPSQPVGGAEGNGGDLGTPGAGDNTVVQEETQVINGDDVAQETPIDYNDNSQAPGATEAAPEGGDAANSGATEHEQNVEAPAAETPVTEETNGGTTAPEL